MERQSVTALVLLDLSVAFNAVCHTVLLKVLEYNFGVKGVALKWFDEYLRPRKLRVCVNDKYSTGKNINFSVAQGSINGLVLFNSYLSIILEVIDTKIAVNAFADDHSLQKEFQPRGENESKTVKLLENNLLSVQLWINANKCKLNPSKTEFIYFSSRQQLGKCSKIILKVSLRPVERLGLVRYLGAFFDENLSFAAHITNQSPQCLQARTSCPHMYDMIRVQCRNLVTVNDLQFPHTLYGMWEPCNCQSPLWSPIPYME